MLDCTYSFILHEGIGDAYTCTARVISVGEPYDVTYVSDNHLEGQDHSTVRGLVFNQTLIFTPRNIHVFFENLEVYISRNTGLPDLTGATLTGLSNLRLLDFGGNNIKTIENDLFIANPFVEIIYFDLNPIRHVASEVFDNLNELHTLNMNDTTCISDFADNDKSKIDILKFRLIVNCPPTFVMTESKIIDGSVLQSKIQQRIDIALDPITAILLEIEEEQLLLQQRIEDLENGAVITHTSQ